MPRRSPRCTCRRIPAAARAGWWPLQNAGLALTWVTQVLALTWEELFAAAANTPTGAIGVVLPLLEGERPANTRSRVARCGRSHRPHRPGPGRCGRENDFRRPAGCRPAAGRDLPGALPRPAATLARGTSLASKPCARGHVPASHGETGTSAQRRGARRYLQSTDGK